jgi:membrane-associated phospholipid phosphatase
MVFIERTGLPIVLSLNFKSDVKRETRFLAQYGQAVCTAIVGWIVWKLDPRGLDASTPLVLAPLAAGGLGALVKRLFGRVRPGHENAGKFLGPGWRHANWRESFPSNHSACAVALSVGLLILYPHGAPIWWTLAITCAVLRYIMDAHWPSDVLGGIAFGYLVANGVWYAARFVG